MQTKGISLLEAWNRHREVQQKTPVQLKIGPAQKKILLDDSALRGKLQDVKMASFLPPVGTKIFRPFTPQSLEDIRKRGKTEERERQRRKENSIESAEDDLPKPANDLEAGKPLPFIYGDPPPDLFNTPLEELDPYYQSQKTFIVISKGNIIQRFNAEPSCFLLGPFSSVRRAAIKILTHSLFSMFILATVLSNCFFIALNHQQPWIKTAECVFTGIYTFEALIKVLSRGFLWHRFSFLRDPWNCLDLLIISVAYATEVNNIGFTSGARAFRVIRVLKIINILPGLKSFYTAMIQSLKRCGDSILVAVFTLAVFALIGLQLFMGFLGQKCIKNWANVNSTAMNDTEGENTFNYEEYVTNSGNYYFRESDLEALLCGNRTYAGACPEGYICLRGGPTPNYGYTSFDNFGWSCLSVFRLMTLDFWENLCHLTLRSAGMLYMFYFVLVLFLGSAYSFCLMLAKAATAYAEQSEAVNAKTRQLEEDHTRLLEALRRRKKALQEMTESSGGSDELEEKEDSEEGKRCFTCWSSFTSIFLKGNCCPCWIRIKQWLYMIVMDPFMDLGITVCVIINVIFLAMEHYPMTPQFEHMLAVGNLVFIGIFTAEMILRLLAMGTYHYFQDGWYIFDTIIVATALLELGIADIEGLSFLRCLRLLRVFKLVRFWTIFRRILRMLRKSVGTLSSLALAFAITIFAFAVVGMHLFGWQYEHRVCKITQDCELPRWHMNDFFHSLMLVFRVVCGEWVECLWDCLEVAGHASCLLFFIPLFLVAYLLVLNSFLTLLLSWFGEESLCAPEKAEETTNVHIAIRRIGGAMASLKVWIMGQLGLMLDPSATRHSDAHTLVPISVSDDEDDSEKKGGSKHMECSSDDCTGDHCPADQNKRDESGIGSLDPCCSAGCYRCCPFPDTDTSLGKSWGRFRWTCLTIVQHSYFDKVIILVILLSSLALAFEDIHLEQRPILKNILEYADYVFTFIFIVEMLLKWVAFGLKTYFTNGWCWLDFLILDVSLFNLTAKILGYSELRLVIFLWTLRAIMPLRALSRFNSLRVVVRELGGAIPSLVSVLLVCLTVWLVLVIIGVNLFAGKFHYCYNSLTEEYISSDVISNKSDCLLMNHTGHISWKQTTVHFDNVVMGYLSLFHVATFSGWLDVMYAATDSRLVENQPIYEANIYIYIYFVLVVIFTSFFTPALFIGVLIDYFNQLKAKSGEKNIFMTEGQMKHYIASENPSCIKPQKSFPRPQNCCLGFVFDLVNHRFFEVFMMVIVCLHMVVLMVETNADSGEKEYILAMTEFSFICLFFLECCLKLICLGRNYFTVGWNIFDCVLVLVDIVGLVLFDLAFVYINVRTFDILRLARIARVQPLISAAKGIRSLLFALKMSLPAQLNIALFMCLNMYCFTIFAMLNFGSVRSGGWLNDMFNFETFGSSLINAFMMTTITGWDGLLFAILDASTNCDLNPENPGSDCGMSIVAIVSFCSYMPLCMLLAFTMCLTIILEHFKVTSEQCADQLNEGDFDMFFDTWEKFDPSATQFVQYSVLSELCDSLKKPLQIPKPNMIKVISLDLPLVPGDKIHCMDVLQALSMEVLGDSEKLETLNAVMEQKFTARYTSKVSYEPVSSTLKRKQEEVKARVIQQAYRRHLLHPVKHTSNGAHPGNQEGPENNGKPNVDGRMGQEMAQVHGGTTEKLDIGEAAASQVQGPTGPAGE